MLKTLWTYDPARAASLLRKAGYGPNAPPIEISVNPINDQGAAEIIVAQLARIGVKAKIRVIPPGSSSWQREVYVNKNPQVALDGTVGREVPGSKSFDCVRTRRAHEFKRALRVGRF